MNIKSPFDILSKGLSYTIDLGPDDRVRTIAEHLLKIALEVETTYTLEKIKLLRSKNGN